MESLYLLFLAFFILFFIFPLTFDIKVSFDVLENRGSLSFRLWPLNFKVSKIMRNGVNILLISKKKNSEIKIKLGEKQLRFLKFFKNEVGNKVKVRKVNVYSKIGMGEPFKSALISSAVSNGILIFLTRLKFWQPTGTFQLKNKTMFYESKFAFASSSRIALSLFDLLYSFLISILRSKNDVILGKKLKNI